MLPNVSFSIDSLWKVLTLLGGLLLAAGLLSPVTYHRDYKVKRAAFEVEKQHLLGEVTALKERKEKNLSFLHQHGAKLLLLMYDEKGKLRSPPPDVPQTLPRR